MGRPAKTVTAEDVAAAKEAGIASGTKKARSAAAKRVNELRDELIGLEGVNTALGKEIRATCNEAAKYIRNIEA